MNKLERKYKPKDVLEMLEEITAGFSATINEYEKHMSAGWLAASRLDIANARALIAELEKQP